MAHDYKNQLSEKFKMKEERAFHLTYQLVSLAHKYPVVSRQTFSSMFTWIKYRSQHYLTASQ